nr:hypothetical protein [Virgibacillus proomii]
MINLQKEDVILKTKQFVFQELNGDASGHDWWHIVQVAKLAKTIALKERTVFLSVKWQHCFTILQMKN